MGGCSSKASSAPPPARERDGIRGVGTTQAEPRAPSVPRVKFVLLGDSGVGKSCLVLRYVRGCFDPSSKVTVGAAYLGHKATLRDGRAARLEVWDTAGQERYASLAPLYYRGAAAAAVVYDVGDAESFAKARHWVGELQRNAGPGIVVVLVGNKVDLGEEAREVPTAEGAEFAERNGMIFVEASAKADKNVREVFERAAAAVLDGIAAKQQQAASSSAATAAASASATAAAG